MFIVWDYTETGGVIDDVTILDTSDFVIETYSFNEAVRIKNSGVPIFGLDCEGNFGLLKVERYRLLLIAETKDTFTFLVHISIRDRFIKEPLIINKNIMFELLNIIKEKRGRKYISIYKLDYNLTNMWGKLEKDMDTYKAKYKLLTGNKLEDDFKYKTICSLSDFIYLIGTYYFHSNGYRGYNSSRSFLLTLDNKLLLQFQLYGFRVVAVGNSLYYVTFSFNRKDFKAISVIKY